MQILYFEPEQKIKILVHEGIKQIYCRPTDMFENTCMFFREVKSLLNTFT
jgi:hypothetical protein